MARSPKRSRLPGTTGRRAWGLERGRGLAALGAWPRARRLAAGADVVYLADGVRGRLLPALADIRGRRVLHVHDMVRRVPAFWRLADLALAEVVRDGVDGRLVAPGDPAALAEAVVAVVADHERMSEAAGTGARRLPSRPTSTGWRTC